MTIFEDIIFPPSEMTLLLPAYDAPGIVAYEPVWVNFDPKRKGTVQIDSIPENRTFHFYDWVSYRFNSDGEAICTGLVEASGYKTLRVSLWRVLFDPETEFARAGIRRSLSKMGLDFEFDSKHGLVLAAIPPSYNLARLDALKFRCPDLRFELG